MQRKGRFEKVDVSADGKGLACHAGSALLVGVADKTGLTDAFSEELGVTRERRSAHDPGEVVRDLCVMIADGGDCLSDLGALRDQDDLFGSVASNATAFRVIASLCEEGMLDCLRAARARARWRAWELGVRPEQIVLDLDATLITSHSDKEEAAGNYKGGFGFHPMLCYLDDTEEALAGILRPGNAGSNTAADQIDCVERALEQLPPDVLEEAELLLRTDSAGLVHDLLDHLSERGVRFSVGMDMTEDVRQAVSQIADQDWAPAVSADGAPREKAFVAELSLDLSGWPEGARAICRRERAHPGAQLSLIDTDGWRHQVFMTDQQSNDIAKLDLTHRG
ncbi:MAG: IS1380 family transposase, partial [Actinobacteria bacterium]|nr:IS1380 family transposase [Actinomycetota bacterium]MCA1699001.1 IS1380 family transposase [Actinomycetota bacterium]